MSGPMTSNRACARGDRGFTMIEVLVTLVILMIGLLGIAGLMAQGQRTSFEAYQRQQALALANDMAERIKANRQGVDGTVVATTYSASLPVATPAGTGARHNQLTSAAITNCATNDCSPAQAVTYDGAVWDGLLFGSGAERTAGGAAIGPILSARGCVEDIGSTVCAAGAATATSRQVTYRVSVAWQGNYPSTPPADQTCGQGTYRDATGAANDNWRRIVSVQVFSVIPCP